MASVPWVPLLTIHLLAGNVFAGLQLSEKLWQDERDYAGSWKCIVPNLRLRLRIHG
jgi:hypothetical protein